MEPRRREDIEQRVGLPAADTSMPLLMNLLLAFRNASPGRKSEGAQNLFGSDLQKGAEPLMPHEMDAKTGGLFEERKEEKKTLKPLMNPPAAQTTTPTNQEKESEEMKGGAGLLGDLPPLTKVGGKASGPSALEIIDIPEEKAPAGRFGGLSETNEREKQNIEEIEKKLKEIENKGMVAEVQRAPVKKDEEEESDIKEEYEQDFEEIEEDLPSEKLEESENFKEANRGNNPTITMSGSLGVDPSVDSIALEEYDHVEPVERE